MDSQSTSRAFPGFSNIYELGEHGGSLAFRGDVELSVKDALAATRGELKPSESVPVRWAMGRKVPTDVIHATSVAPLVVHDRVVEVLKKGNFRGWDVYPVEVFGKAGEFISGYHGLSVLGRCGPIDDSMSVQVPRLFPAKVSMVWKGVYFDPDTWDGSDLFMPAGNVSWIFVVEEVKRALEKAKIKNLTFGPLDEVERSIL